MLIKVRNFKAIKEADVEVEGMTLVCGENSAGKSTLLKALKAAMVNVSNDSYYRRGANEFHVYMKLPDPKTGQIQQAMYSRASNTVTYRKNDGTLLQKVGKATMQELIPEFPLKFFPLKDSKFFPNFVYQEEIPLFSQVDIYELLSGMFQSVNKLLTYRERLKRDMTMADANVQTASAGVEFQTGQLKQVNDKLAAIDQKKVTDDYSTLVQFEASFSEWTSLVNRAADIDRQLGLSEHLRWADALDLKEVEAVLQVVQQYEPKLQKIRELENSIAQLELSIPKWEPSELVGFAPLEDVLKMLAIQPLPEPEEFPYFQLTEADLIAWVSASIVLPPPLPVEELDAEMEASLLLYELRSERNEFGMRSSEADQAEAQMYQLEEELNSVDHCPMCGSSGIHLHLEAL